VTAYRVFIATPGNLQPERRAFRDVLQEYVESDGIHRGIMLIPVGWEDTLAGVGRPQEKINEDLRSCDYCLVVLWDRWGTPPTNSSQAKFTSGTEEEFEVARECLSSPEFPMRNIIVLFKAVDDSKLSDPGEQLKAVLKFKKHLETSKEHFYTTFDDTAAFQKTLRKLLAQWVRDHEHGATRTITQHLLDDVNHTVERDAAAEEGRSEHVSSNSARRVTDAQNLANVGRLTEAEAIFAKSVAGGNDPHAMIQYSRFLARLGRVSQAEAMVQRVATMPEAAGTKWQARALRHLATIARATNKLEIAEREDKEALKISTEIGDEDEIGRSYSEMAETYWKKGDLALASELASKALEIGKSLKEPTLLTSAYQVLATIYYTMGDLPRAEEMYAESLRAAEQFGGPDDLAVVAVAYHNYGLTLLERGDIEGADKKIRAALEINKKIGRLHGIGRASRTLGGIAIKRGDWKSAYDLLSGAMDAFATLGNADEALALKAQLENISIP
jgi:tetratricopeptide (TPR) repeat protein